jgi:hypothetical protein
MADSEFDCVTLGGVLCDRDNFPPSNLFLPSRLTTLRLQINIINADDDGKIHAYCISTNKIVVGRTTISITLT